MAETFSRFDAADYLTTEEGIAAFLEAASEGDDAGHTLRALATVARARNMAQLARDAGMSREGLYKALSPEGNPSFGTVANVAKAMGFRIMIAKAETPRVGAVSYAGGPSINEAMAASAKGLQPASSLPAAVDQPGKPVKRRQRTSAST